MLSDIWNGRSLLVLLAFNDVKLRYRNSFLGFVWSFLEPLLILAVLYFVFSNIIKTDIEYYPLYLLLGLVIWFMFSRSTTSGLSSLTDRAGIIQKTNVSREIIVASSCLTSFIMMILEFAAFGVFVIAFQFTPPLTVLLLPILLIELLVLSVGISFILSILNVYFKDIKFIWQIVLQAGFFLSPIIYKLDMFPDPYRSILNLNPMVHILESAHGLVLYNQIPSVGSVLYIIGTTMIIFVIGYIIFKIKNKKIAEEL